MVPLLSAVAGSELIPVIGYIRVSSWFEEKISDELQRAAIAESTRRKGRHVVSWVTDLDATGRNFRRKIMGAIQAIETGECEGAKEIWVWKFSRFGRTRHGVAINLARIERAGGQLFSATEDVDASTATGEFTRDMLFAVAAFESNRASEQWRETHQYRLDHGLPATGGQRWGYLWTPRVADDGQIQIEGYDPNPEIERLQAEQFERYADGGCGFATLAVKLNDGGHLNAHGRPWSQNGLKRTLDGGFGAGYLHVHKRDIHCPDRAHCTKWRDHYEHIPAAHTPVIGDDLWEAYQARRAQRRTTPPRARMATYPLTGVAKCGGCGYAAVHIGRSGHRGYALFCGRRQRGLLDCPAPAWVQRATVEQGVRRHIECWASGIDAVAEGVVVESAQPATVDTSRRRAELVREIARRAVALDRNQEMYTLGDVERDEWQRARDRHRAAKAEAEAELEQLDEVGQERRDAASYRDVIEGLARMWDTLLVGTKQDLLGALVHGVYLFPKTSDPVRVWARWEPKPEWLPKRALVAAEA
ncbi:recombinase family protein [Streptomyces sp. NPDC092296]|uniref:recombinase family protein n=1 Tax=Streptomyces sp. NPDC092296 TaxID=3366012 RepID=UPI0037F8997C